MRIRALLLIASCLATIIVSSAVTAEEPIQEKIPEDTEAIEQNWPDNPPDSIDQNWPDIDEDPPED